ncbi:MAG: AhpC/TSA family protein [Gammaproteobacteria bacterium]|nr:MAG: AhpC/TSA family protein [Gammaproteobacteria bacterium]
MNLSEAIQTFKQNFVKNVPDKTLQTMQAATEALVESNLAEKALKMGDRLPDFELPNATGQIISSQNLLEQGPLVINFYRGAWCPYCNLELRAYQAILPDLNQFGARLVAISPNLPDHSLSSIEKHQLKFEVLSDLGNRYARKCGLVFTLPEAVREVYAGFDIDLSSYNGDDRFELPLPATFVVDASGDIRLRYVNADYTQRLEPGMVLDTLREIVDR